MKNYHVIFSKSSLKDLKEAKQWYSIQQKGLGKRLIEDIKITTSSIKQNPFFASIKYNTIRTVACQTFPYAIHYEIDEINSIVRIVSVFHFSRKPFWLGDSE
jgi:chlorite dismutase